jgi:hypothetical protein
MVGRVINGRGLRSHATAAYPQAVLLADAIFSGTAGMILAAGAGPLSNALGLPEAMLRVTGPALVPYAFLMGYLATRDRLARAWIWACVVGNLLWVAASGLLLVSGRVEPTGLGIAFVIAQALVVAAVADLEWLSFWRGSEA